MLKKSINKQGYLVVNLYLNSKRKQYKVHRLVAKAFIPNLENKPFINHINGIKTDNKVDNLEWCTPRENQLHAYKYGLQKGSRAIIQFDLENNPIKEWDTIKEAKNQLKIRNISACCRGKRKTAGGYVWKYKESK